LTPVAASCCGSRPRREAGSARRTALRGLFEPLAGQLRELAWSPQGCRRHPHFSRFDHLHLSRDRASPECRRLLERCEAGEVAGVTSVVAVVDVAHRLMMIEAVATGLVSGKNVLREPADLA